MSVNQIFFGVYDIFCKFTIKSVIFLPQNAPECIWRSRFDRARWEAYSAPL